LHGTDRCCASKKHPAVIPAHDNRGSICKSHAVLEEIFRVEKETNLLSMQPEEALQLLQELLLDLDMGTFSRTELLEGLAQACWHLPANKPWDSYISSRTSPSVITCQSQKPLLSPQSLPRILSNTTRANRHPSPGCDSNSLIPVRYSQLYNGLLENLKQKQQEIERQKKTLLQVIQMNNSIPQEIHQVESKIQETIDIFIQWATVELDSQQSTTSSTCNNNADQILMLFKEELVKLHRRKELRLWSCNDLRNVIQGHITRGSELRKEITQIVFELKNKEQEHTEKMKRMDEISQAEKNQKTRVLSLQQSIQILEEQIEIASTTKVEIQQKINEKKKIVQTKTQTIFDVRARVKELQQRKTDVLIQIEALSEQDLYIQRTCTPRPEWETLIANNFITTKAYNRVGSMRRIRFEEKSKDKEQQLEEMKYINQIVTSQWSTIQKIQALTNELIKIRTENHSDEVIAIEKEKLKYLQLEIAKTLEQLQAIKMTGTTTTTTQNPVPVPHLVNITQPTTTTSDTTKASANSS
jgi:hypothetical protein